MYRTPPTHLSKGKKVSRNCTITANLSSLTKDDFTEKLG